MGKSNKGTILPKKEGSMAYKANRGENEKVNAIRNFANVSIIMIKSIVNKNIIRNLKCMEYMRWEE